MRVVYWSTACLEAGYEAVSKELLWMATSFRPCTALSVNPHSRLRVSWRDRTIGFHPSLYAGVRWFVPAIERRHDLNHIYGDATPWFFSEALRTRPVIHTVTQGSAHANAEILARCEVVVVQTDRARADLVGLGFPKERLHVWLPGIDRKRFRPQQRPEPSQNSPRVLFATAPRAREEMGPRGVELLLDTAAMRPELRFRFIYRPCATGYTSLEPTAEGIRSRGLGNVELTNGAVSDMPALYREHDFTVIPFTEPDGGKECPNSALESLACGIPVLVSTACPFAEFVAERECGVTFAPEPGALLGAIERGLANWQRLSRSARLVAESEFCQDELRRKYAQLYGHCCARRTASGSAVSIE